MYRFSLLTLVILVMGLAACASQKGPQPRVAKKATVITVARNGAVKIDHKKVQLRSLVAALKAEGVTKKTRLAVEGETGTDQRDIERVLEALVSGGLLPKGTID